MDEITQDTAEKETRPPVRELRGSWTTEATLRKGKHLREMVRAVREGGKSFQKERVGTERSVAER